MIIDIHTHTFPDRIARAAIDKLSKAAHAAAFTDASNQSLLSSMEKAGIDLSVIAPVATSPAQVEKINDSAARLTETYMTASSEDVQLMSFGCIHPDYPHFREELKRLISLGIRGIKLHPVYQGVNIDDIRFLRILDCAASLGLVVLTHAGLDIGFPGVVHCSPMMCRHALEEIGPFPFILAHMGGWHEWEDVLELLPGTGCYIDTSFSTDSFTPLSDGYWKEGEEKMLSPEAFVRLVRAFGADHVIFGSDSPWSDQKVSLDWIRDCGPDGKHALSAEIALTQEEIQLILGENARNILKLS
ncbi:MAG: amidohydrolase family protein [Firmicutes bacterium]|nr:amidohydrolase family protein [Bacillota bacterium]